MKRALFKAGTMQGFAPLSQISPKTKGRLWLTTKSIAKVAQPGQSARLIGKI